MDFGQALRPDAFGQTPSAKLFALRSSPFDVLQSKRGHDGSGNWAALPSLFVLDRQNQPKRERRFRADAPLLQRPAFGSLPHGKVLPEFLRMRFKHSSEGKGRPPHRNLPKNDRSRQTPCVSSFGARTLRSRPRNQAKNENARSLGARSSEGVFLSVGIDPELTRRRRSQPDAGAKVNSSLRENARARWPSCCL